MAKDSADGVGDRNTEDAVNIAAGNIKTDSSEFKEARESQNLSLLVELWWLRILEVGTNKRYQLVECKIRMYTD